MKVVLYTEGLPFTGDTLEQQALGGSETAFISVARELARKGHDVHAYCMCPKPGVFDGVVVPPRAGSPRMGDTGVRRFYLFPLFPCL